MSAYAGARTDTDGGSVGVVTCPASMTGPVDVATRPDAGPADRRGRIVTPAPYKAHCRRCGEWWDLSAGRLADGRGLKCPRCGHREDVAPELAAAARCRMFETTFTGGPER